MNEALLNGLQHIIFISSTSVFPDVSGEFDEQSQIVPQSEMSKALLEIEQWLFERKMLTAILFVLGDL